MSARERLLSRIAVGCVLLTALGGGSAYSQESASQESTAPGAEGRAASEAPQEVGPPEHVIYIPFKDFSDVWENPDASVVIPHAEYLRLRSLLLQEPAIERRPVDAVITAAAYTATVAEDIAQIRAELTVNVVGKPWVKVPIQFGGAAVGDVSSEGGKVLLQGTGEGTYLLLFEQQGRQQISLELTARVVTTPDGRQIAFDCPPAAVTHFELTVPQPDQEVEIRPRLVQEPAASGEGGTRIRASLGATRHIAATWRPRATAKPEMQLLANVTNRQRYHVADGLIHTDAWLTYEVLRGELKQLRIIAPADHDLLDVTASTKIQNWQTERTDDAQILTIELLAPVDDRVTVELHTEQKLADSAVALGGYDGETVHGIHALEVARESGQLVVTHSSDLNLRVASQAGLVRIEPGEVAEEIRHPGGLSYKYYQPGFTLEVTVSPVEPRVRVAQLTHLVIGEEELEAYCDLTYTIERAGVFELGIGLPDGLVIDDVQSEHLQEYRIDEGVLTAVLQERTVGRVSLAITAHQELGAAATDLTLPVPEPLDVERETGVVKLFADDSVELASNEELLEGARPAAAPPGETRGDARLRAAWQFTYHPVTIPVTLTRKPTRLSATVATDINVEPSRTRVTTLVDFHIEYAGLDTFRLRVPEEAMDTLQIEAVPTSPTSPALKQKTAGDPADGWVPFTLLLQREALGLQRFRLTYDLEPAAAVAAVTVEADAAANGDAAADGDAAAEGAAPAGAERSGNQSSTQPEDDDSARGDGSPAGGDASAEGDASGTGSEGSTGDATSEGEREELDPHRLQTTIRIIRPLGIEAAGERGATPLTQVGGEIRIAKEPSLTITADATGGDAEPIDVRELTRLPKSGTLAFRYREHPLEETIAVDLTQARYETEEVVATVVSRALVEIVLGEDRTATYRCRYRLKTTERQRLRVELPKALQVLSVLVDEREVRLQPDPGAAAGELWDSYFVNVARNATSDKPFALTFQFLWVVNPQPFERGLQGSIVLPLPRIGGAETAAVQQSRVVVWVPDEYALIGDPDDFTLLGETSLWSALWGGPLRSYRSVEDEEQWIGGTNNALLEFPTTGRVAYRYSNLGGDGEGPPAINVLWWYTLGYTVVVSVAIFVIGLLLLRTSWENKLGFLLLLAFAATLLGLKSEHVLAHALAAARWGLLFLLALWLVEAVFGRRRRTATVKPAIPEMGHSGGPTFPAPVAVVPPPGVFEDFQSERPRDQDFR